MIANLQPLINFPLIIYVGMGINPYLHMKSQASTWKLSIKIWKLISTYKGRNGRHMDAQLCVMG